MFYKASALTNHRNWDVARHEMVSMFHSFCVQPRHWELEHSESDDYECYVLSRFCVQPRHWELEHSASDDMESMFRTLLRSTKTLGVGTQDK